MKKLLDSCRSNKFALALMRLRLILLQLQLYLNALLKEKNCIRNNLVSTLHNYQTGIRLACCSVAGDVVK